MIFKYSFLLVIFVFACASYKDVPRNSSYQIPPVKISTESGYIALIDGKEAFTSRMYLARHAKRSLDLQYYIWHDDESGKNLLKTIMEAAERGVRVRLLLDNMNEAKFQRGFAILEKHPNVEIRLVNPGFKNINRRMHNKSFIADNYAAIIGGRNIGNEYFKASDEMNFGDFDILIHGKKTMDVSTQFDLYWNHSTSVPISGVYKPELGKEVIKEANDFFAKIDSDRVSSPDPFRNRTYHGKSLVVYDQPSKLEGKKGKTNLVASLSPILKSTKKELILISPYFIPGRDGMKTLEKLKQKGVDVIIVTNSLASNDVASVFGGYKKYRKNLLKRGVDLYEINAKPESYDDEKKFGSSGATGLHGKVLISDRKTIFVGSMNLDPRSKNLNSEMGIVLFDSPLAKDVAEALEQKLPEIAFRLKLTGGELRWVENVNGERHTYKSEPKTTFWLQTKAWFSSIFIPESLL